MQWFKFYGQDFLTDPKIKTLLPAHRLIWITLLCLASNTEDGLIKFLTEEKLTVLTDIPLTDGTGVLQIFVDMEMITIIDDKHILVNKYRERQETHLSASERASKSRRKRREREVNSVNKSKVNSVNARIDKNRIDKNRIDKTIEKRKESARTLVKSESSLNSIKEPDIKEIAEKYNVPLAFVRSIYDDMVLWAGERPNNPKLKDRNWKLTLMKWVKKDALERREGAKNSAQRIKYVGDPL